MHSILTEAVAKDSPHLSMIFEKDPNGKYTRDALLYQDILQYIFARDSKYASREPEVFVFDELAGWLVMEKSQEFKNDYQDFASRTPKYRRINAKRRKIQKRIDNLLEMFLLVVVEPVKSRRNNEYTSLYKYSKHGKVIAWIIRSQLSEISANERNEIYKQIYNLVQSLFLPTDKSSDYQLMSRYLFKSKFFDKCWNEGIFDQIVNMMAELLHHKSLKARDIIDILNHIVYEYVSFTHKKFRSILWAILMETLNELDEATRKIVIYYEKLAIERKIYGGDVGPYSRQTSREWEEVWFANRNEYSKLTLFGHCSRCKFSGPLIVDYYKFKKEALLDNDDLPTFKTDCHKCKAKDKLIVTTCLI